MLPTLPAPAVSPGRAAKRAAHGDRSYAPDRVLVRYRGGVSAAKKNRSMKNAGLAKVVRKIGPKGDKNTHLLKLDKGVAVPAAVDALRSDSAVLFAEPDYIYKADFTPSDPRFGDQWGLNNTGQVIMGTAGVADADIDGPEAWGVFSPAETATVAVIDTGVDYTHPDLASKIWTNAGEVAGIAGFDDDGNGYVDDVNGHNWASISQYGVDPDPLVYFGSAAPDPFYSEVAQSFVGNGGSVKGAGFDIDKYNVPTDGIRVSIRSSLTGSDLGFADLAVGDIPTIGWVQADFATPIPVDQGSTYYLVLHTDTNNFDDSYAIYGTSSDYYPDGNFYAYDGSWAPDASADMEFELLFAGTGGRGGSPKDDDGHGTHVSGIIGATGNDATGVVGVAGYPEGGVEIMPLRVLDTWGSGYNSDIVDAVYYAADNGADVINLSLGGGGFSGAFQDAVNYADSAGVVVLAAAGNNGNTTTSYPAGYANVIGVGATTNLDTKASFSNFNGTVDVSAPGLNILSTVPSYPFLGSTLEGNSLNHEYYSGTSMATPMAAGLAALLRAQLPGLSPSQVQSAMQLYSDDLGAAGRDNSFGYGRINAFATLLALADSEPPTGTVTIDSGAAYTSTTAVTLNLDATDSLAGPAQMRFSNEGGALSGWRDFTATTTWTMSAGDGVKEVAAQFSDLAANESTAATDSIILDTQKPDDPDSFNFSHLEGVDSTDKTIDASFSGATDTASGVEGYSISWTNNTTEVPNQTVDLIASGSATESTTSVSLGDSSWYFNLRTKDVAGNWTSTVHKGPFGIDTTKPSGTVKINAGAVNTKSTAIALNIAASDGAGSGLDLMRFSSDGAFDDTSGAEKWHAYAAAKGWTLSSTNGTKQVWAQFKDKVGHESVVVSDTIFLDTKKPTARIFAPAYSTNVSNNAYFRIYWNSADAAPSSGIVSYDVQSKLGSSGAWTNFKTGTSLKTALFNGVAGKTYSFRSRTKDGAGNVSDWSPQDQTIVPHDQTVLTARGFWANLIGAKLYKSSSKRSSSKGAKLTCEFSQAKQIVLIATKRSNGGYAKVYIDGALIRTVNLYSPSSKYRVPVPIKSFSSPTAGKLEIVVTGTKPAGSRGSAVEIDGLAKGT